MNICTWWFKNIDFIFVSVEANKNVINKSELIQLENEYLSKISPNKMYNILSKAYTSLGYKDSKQAKKIK